MRLARWACVLTRRPSHAVPQLPHPVVPKVYVPIPPPPPARPPPPEELPPPAQLAQVLPPSAQESTAAMGAAEEGEAPVNSQPK